MLASAKIMAFIVARDRQAAKTFYGETLGLQLLHEDDFAIVFDCNGTTLRISTMADHIAQKHTVLGWQVADIRQAAAGLRARGVAFMAVEGFQQDDQGIWSPPGSSVRVAWFADPDGNVLSLTE